MSLHKLAEVTIAVYGLPEYCGTDEQLQELTDDAEALIDSIGYTRLLNEMLANAYSRLNDKIVLEIEGP